MVTILYEDVNLIDLIPYPYELKYNTFFNHYEIVGRPLTELSKKYGWFKDLAAVALGDDCNTCVWEIHNFNLFPGDRNEYKKVKGLKSVIRELNKFIEDNPEMYK